MKSLNNAINSNSKDLKAIGVATRNADGSARTHMQVLTDLAEAYKKADDKTEVLAAGAKTLGRGFSALLPVLAGGKKGIDDVAASAKAMGLVLTQDNIQAVRDYSKALKENKQATLGLQVQVGQATLPFETWKAKAIGGALAKLNELNPAVAQTTGAVGSVAGSMLKYSGTIVTVVAGLKGLRALRTITALMEANTVAAGADAVAVAGLGTASEAAAGGGLLKLAGIFGPIGVGMAAVGWGTWTLGVKSAGFESAKAGKRTAQAIGSATGAQAKWTSTASASIPTTNAARYAISHLGDSASSARGKVNALAGSISSLKSRTVRVDVVGPRGVTFTVNAGSRYGYAQGGIANGPATGYPVTLHGREAILPLSNPARTQQVLKEAGVSTGSLTINVTANGSASPAEIKASVKEALREESRYSRRVGALA